ncbi:MAG: DNA repair protein RadA [Bacillota bacterium]|nr:DNA repair protein RadA [Bacillota bacterium]
MKKSKLIYICNECGSESQKWMGQCPVCGAWNSFFEQKIVDADETDSRRRSSALKKSATGVDAHAGVYHKLKDVTASTGSRIDTGIGELNRVLGGGLILGSLTLITGEPGIGKSTLILQAAANIAKQGPVLYVSGEESEEQIKMRADRICKLEQDGDNLFSMAETNIEIVIETAKQLSPKLLIIDSIQTMYSEEIDSAPGSISQVRQVGNLLMTLAKTEGIPVFIVAHVTKAGELAGPKIVEHLVDTVLEFSGERSGDLRILRAVKNRFGTTAEIGAFDMAEEGLIEIENLSGALLDGMADAAEGSVATAVNEGTRPLLLEIQALTSQTAAGFPMRRSVGFDNNRLSMIIAVLEKKAGLNLYATDVYVNVVGGFKPQSTSTDLAVALAIYSEKQGKAVPKDVIAIGEIGLTGELRPVQNCERLLKEAERMGFKEALIPAKNINKIRGKLNIKLTGISNVKEALR